jgi:hypothetical protein
MQTNHRAKTLSWDSTNSCHTLILYLDNKYYEVQSMATGYFATTCTVSSGSFYTMGIDDDIAIIHFKPTQRYSSTFSCNIQFQNMVPVIMHNFTCIQLAQRSLVLNFKCSDYKCTSASLADLWNQKTVKEGACYRCGTMCNQYHDSTFGNFRRTFPQLQLIKKNMFSLMKQLNLCDISVLCRNDA